MHSDAARVEATDWSQIVALYDRLLVVALDLIEELDLRHYSLFRVGSVDRSPSPDARA